MKRAVSSVLLIISGILIGTMVYFAQKPDMEEFIVKESRLLFYSDVSRIGDIDRYESLVQEFVYDYEDFTELEKYKKYLKQVLVLNFGSEADPVIFLDFDKYYVGLRLRIMKYFDKSGEFYKLKSEYSQGDDLYLKPFKGYFLAAGSEQGIQRYLDYSGEPHKELLNAYAESKQEYSSFALLDIDESLKDQSFDPGIRIVRLSLMLEGSKLRIDADHFEELESAKDFETGNLEKRELTSYIGKNRLYFSNNDIKSLGLIFKNKLSKPVQSLVDSIGFFTGLGFEELLGNLDDEICIDLDSKAAVARIKSTENYRGLLKLYKSRVGEFFEISKNLKVLLEEKRLYLNSKLEKGRGEELAKDEFLCLELDLKKFDRKFEPDTVVQMRLSSKESRFRMSLILGLEELRKIYRVLKIDGARGIESDKAI